MGTPELKAEGTVASITLKRPERADRLKPDDLAVIGMKKHLNRIARGTRVAEDLQRDSVRAVSSGDLQEGTKAWAETRAPRFTGR